MSLHEDLLRHAQSLAAQDRRRPKQAHLRRAVSAAYYALFHLLCWSATRRWIRGRHQAHLRSALGRAFQHGTMKDACGEIAKQAGGKLGSALGGAPVPPRLIAVGRAFAELQQARHDADYDVAREFRRSEVLDLIEIAVQAFADWTAVKGDPAADVFLAALLAKNGMCR